MNQNEYDPIAKVPKFMITAACIGIALVAIGMFGLIVSAVLSLLRGY